MEFNVYLNDYMYVIYKYLINFIYEEKNGKQVKHPPNLIQKWKWKR